MLDLRNLESSQEDLVDHYWKSFGADLWNPELCVAIIWGEAPAYKIIASGISHDERVALFINENVAVRWLLKQGARNPLPGNG